jgi:hypothetical protein
MENRKDIGKAFREKMDGLQKSPGDHVWQSIRQDLPKKNRRLLLPLWFRVAIIPVAALFVIGFFTYQLWQEHVPHVYFKMPRETKDEIITTKTNPSEGVAAKPEATPSLSGSKDGTGKATYNNTATPVAESGNSNNKNALGTVSPAGEISSAHNKQNKGGSEFNGSSATHHLSYGSHTGSRKRTSARRHESESDAVNTGNTLATAKIYPGKSDINFKGEENTVAGSTKGSEGKKTTSSNIPSQANTIANRDDRNTNTPGNNSDTPADVTKSPADTTAEALAKNSKDSIKASNKVSQIASRPKKAETEKDDHMQMETEYKHAYIYAFAAPAIYDTEDAAYIDASLSGKEVAAKKAFNYGVYLGFNVSPKWSLRVGVISSNLELTTNNVTLSNSYNFHEPTEEEPNGWFETIAPTDFSGISYTTGISNNSVRESLGNYLDERDQLVADFSIYHKLKYIEVPLEATYVLYDQKFRIGITGGFSARFLTENKIYAENSQGNINLGKYKDMDKMNYGASLGAGFYYELIPALQFNLEPVARYYFNSPNNIKPVTFGVQAGLQYNINLSKKEKK